MSTPPMYLKPNIVPEPLYARWYAWPHLISPATAARNVVGRHLKIMNSFIQAPHIHAAAVKNPKMLGGPFVDYPESRVSEIRELFDWTRARQANVIAFSEAIDDLSQMLAQKAKGHSMEPLYAEVPDVLKGYVELVYDLEQRPSFRFFEALLYHSPFYDTAAQSIALYQIGDDERPFVLSTPRLRDPHVVELPVAFKDNGIDRLFAMQRQPGDVQALAEALQVEDGQRRLFESFFTTQAPPAYQPYDGKGVRTRYFGHACILVETRDVSFLVDPVISYSYQSQVSRYTYLDLPPQIDYVLITHNHQDHILFETLLQLRHRVGAVVVPKSNSGSLQDPSLKLMLEAVGFENVIELGDLDQIRRGAVTITGLPFLGEHSDLDIRSKLCHHVRIDDYALLFAADSCNIEPKLYEHVQRITGPVDVLFLGMECDGAPLSWLYGPLLTNLPPREQDFSRKLNGCNFERAQDLVLRFNPSDIFIYAMGQEPWLNYIMSLKYTSESLPIVASNQLLEFARRRGCRAERLYGEREIIQ